MANKVFHQEQAGEVGDFAGEVGSLPETLPPLFRDLRFPLFRMLITVYPAPICLNLTAAIRSFHPAGLPFCGLFAKRRPQRFF